MDQWSNGPKLAKSNDLPKVPVLKCQTMGLRMPKPKKRTPPFRANIPPIGGLQVSFVHLPFFGLF